MTSTTFFIIFIPILSVILLSVNLLLAPHNPYQEKDSVFECGFHSFLGQNRTQFSVSFFIFGLLFLLFDLEILLVYPYSVSSYTNDIYGLIIMIVFFVLLTLGFIFELGKNALSIDSKQTVVSNNKDVPSVDAFFGLYIHSNIMKQDRYKSKFTLVVIFIIFVLLLYIVYFYSGYFIICDAPTYGGANILTESLPEIHNDSTITYFSVPIPPDYCGVCLEGHCDFNSPHQVVVAENTPCPCCGVIPGVHY